MTISKNGVVITNDSGKNIDFKQPFEAFGLEGILKMLQVKEPDLVLADLTVTETTQSAIDGASKMLRLGLVTEEQKSAYLEIVKLGQNAEDLMANFLKAEGVYKTFEGTTYNTICDCGFYVGNPGYPNFDKIPKKAEILTVEGALGKDDEQEPIEEDDTE